MSCFIRFNSLRISRNISCFNVSNSNDKFDIQLSPNDLDAIKSSVEVADNCFRPSLGLSQPFNELFWLSLRFQFFLSPDPLSSYTKKIK